MSLCRVTADVCRVTADVCRVTADACRVTADAQARREQGVDMDIGCRCPAR